MLVQSAASMLGVVRKSFISFEEWVVLKTQHTGEWLVGLDFKIFAKTVLTVLKGAGATQISKSRFSGEMVLI